jgi:hypothetical protein
MVGDVLLRAAGRVDLLQPPERQPHRVGRPCPGGVDVAGLVHVLEDDAQEAEHVAFVWGTPVGPVTVRLPVRTSRSTTVFRNAFMPEPLRSLMTVGEDMWSGRAVF